MNKEDAHGKPYVKQDDDVDRALRFVSSSLHCHTIISSFSFSLKALDFFGNNY